MLVGLFVLENKRHFRVSIQDLVRAHWVHVDSHILACCHAEANERGLSIAEPGIVARDHLLILKCFVVVRMLGIQQ